jgi:hypothetical protein
VTHDQEFDTSWMEISKPFKSTCTLSLVGTHPGGTGEGANNIGRSLQLLTVSSSTTAPHRLIPLIMTSFNAHITLKGGFVNLFFGVSKRPVKLL